MSVKVIDLLKVLLVTYIITGIMLVLLAAGLYKMQFSKSQINIGIMVIYAFSAIVGGYIIGRKKKSRRLVWGVLLGVLYFLVLSLVSFAINRGLYGDVNAALKAAIICIAGGAVGGMIS